MISSIIAVIGINGITQFYKKAVTRYGDSIVHLFVFLMALAFSAGYAYVNSNPSLSSLAEHAVAIAASAITMYEVVWKQIMSVVNVNTQ